MSQLKVEYGNKTIQDFVGLFEKDQLNLEPGFQRDSVWQPSDRRKLVESIFQKFPVPSIFLYKQINDDGKLTYDVIDGKQRLETILMFQGLGYFRGQRFSVSASVDSGEPDEWDWRRIQRKGHEHLLMGYKIQTVEIEGDLSEIIELFVRINSTGKSLTSAERRHAKYFKSTFLLQAEELARKNKNYLSIILSSGQISRMKHVELVCELLTSVYSGGLIDKKKAVDKIVGGHSVDKRSLEKCSNQFTRVLHLVRSMFPDIATTRFAKVVDFYSLFMLVYEMDSHERVLNDRKRNKQAQELLILLSNGVDQVRQQVRRAEGATPEQSLFRDYLFTVQADTDSLSTRKRRAEILNQVLAGLFEQKDSRRNFTIEQRRLIWHSDENKKCKGKKCGGETLSWNNFTIDHVLAHGRGGRTAISNAAIMCRTCNSSKGIQ
jgi:hypothetical protein